MLAITAEVVHHNAIKIAAQTNFLCRIISNSDHFNSTTWNINFEFASSYLRKPKIPKKYLSVKIRWQMDHFLIDAGNTKWEE